MVSITSGLATRTLSITVVGICDGLDLLLYQRSSVSILHNTIVVRYQAGQVLIRHSVPTRRGINVAPKKITWLELQYAINMTQSDVVIHVDRSSTF